MANTRGPRGPYKKRATKAAKRTAKAKWGKSNPDLFNKLNIELSDEYPFPTRGDTELITKLKEQIKQFVPKMKPRRHSFPIPAATKHTISTFLQTEYPEHSFRKTKDTRNPDCIRIWKAK